VWEYDVLLKCLDREWLGYSRREIAERGIVPLRQLIRECPGYSIINRTLTAERGATGAHFHPHAMPCESI